MAAKMKDIEQRVILKVDADVKDVEKQYTKINDSLKKIDRTALPKEAQTGIKSMDKDILKVRDKLSKGFTSSKEIKEFEIFLNQLKNKWASYAKQIGESNIDFTKVYSREADAYKKLQQAKLDADKKLANSRREVKGYRYTVGSKKFNEAIQKDVSDYGTKGLEQSISDKIYKKIGDLSVYRNKVQQYSNLKKTDKRFTNLDTTALVLEKDQQKNDRAIEKWKSHELGKKKDLKAQDIEDYYQAQIDSLKYADENFTDAELKKIEDTLHGADKTGAKNRLNSQIKKAKELIDNNGGTTAAAIQAIKKEKKNAKTSFTNSQKAIANNANIEKEIKLVDELIQKRKELNEVRKVGSQYTELAKNIDRDSVGVDKAQQALDNYGTKVAGATEQNVKNIEQGLNESSKDAGHMADNMHDASRAAGEAEEKVKKFSQIKSTFNYWFSMGTIINKLSQAVSNAIRDFSALDKQFNEISIVTGKTMNELWDGFSNLNRIAQKYGVVTSNVVSVQKLYYQQGRKAAEVTQLTDETLKFAKVSGLDFAEATNYMTASINAFKISASEAGQITDTFSALAAAAAVDAKEVAIAMSKVASLAASAGATFKDTSAFLTKIIETTREAPETAGTALKTIIARFTEVRDLTEDQKELLDDDFNFNHIEEALKTVGVQSKDTMGQLRSFSDIITELGPKWDKLSNNQQRYIATAAAGARQQSRFIALMDDWGRTVELMETAENSAGTGAKQLELALDSIETKTNQLKATWQSFYAEFIDTSAIKNLVSLANKLLGILTKITQVPVIGAPLTLAFIALSVKLLKIGIKSGKRYATGFWEGFRGVDRANEAKENADDVKDNYERGKRAGKAYSKGYDLGQRTGDTAPGKSGRWSRFKGGLKHPFKTLKNNRIAKAEQTAQAVEIGKMSKVAKAGGLSGKVITTGGVKSAASLATTLGAAASTVAIVVGVLAAMYGIAQGLAAWDIHRAEKIAKQIEKSNNSIKDTIKENTSLTKEYNEALELQRKGLAKTKEEAEKYQKVLTELKEINPQLVKTLSDGTLELNSQISAYDDMIKKQEESIQKNQEIIDKKGNRALSWGLTMTDEGATAKQQIKNIAATLSEKSEDELKEYYGLRSDIKPEDFKIMSERGLTRESLNKAAKDWTQFGIPLTASQYEGLADFILANQLEQGQTYKDLFKNNRGLVEKTGIKYGQLEEISSLLDVLNEQAGYDVVKTQIESGSKTGRNRGEARQWADFYAGTEQTIVNASLAKGFEELGDSADHGKEVIKAYYKEIDDTRRQKFEEYLNKYNTSGKLNEEISENSLLNMLGLPSDSKMREVFSKISENLSTERNKLEKESLKRISNFSKKVNRDEFLGYSEEQLQHLSYQVSKVGERYDKNAGIDFLNKYKKYYEDYLQFNPDLNRKFLDVDISDNSSIATFGAKLAQAYGDSSDQYVKFMEAIRSGSTSVDRTIKSVSQLAKDASKDVEGLQKSMDNIGKGLEGKLSITDVLDMISELPETVDFNDFTATADGYLLTESKALEIRKEMVQLKLYEYQIQMMLAQATVNDLEKENERFADIFAKQEKVAKGKATIQETQQLQTEFDNLTESEKRADYEQYSMAQKAIEFFKAIIPQIQQITFDVTTGIDKITSKLEKLINLLERLKEYSDIDAYIEDLNLKLAHSDFELEFSTNIDNIAETAEEKMTLLNNSLNANLAKSQRAELNAAKRRKDLEKNFGNYVKFDEEGNLLTQDEAIIAKAEQLQKINTSTDEGRKKFETENKILDTLFNQIDAYREERKIEKQSLNEADEKLKQIKEFNDTLKKNVVTLENKFRSLFQKRDEEALNSLKERYNAMKETDKDYLDSVKEAVEKERALRDKNKSYDDVSKMERKLALLQMSGGSKVEIQELQEEIKEKRQDLADQEQDDLLNKIDEENNKRAEKMDEEIDFHQHVLEEKKKNQIAYNREIAELLKQDKQTIINTWKTLDEEYKTGSTLNKELIESNMDSMVSKGEGSALALSGTWIPEIEKAYGKVSDAINIVRSTMEEYSREVEAAGSENGQSINGLRNLAEEYFNIEEALDKLLEKQRAYNELMGQAVVEKEPLANIDKGKDIHSNAPKFSSGTVEEVGINESGHSIAKIDGKWYNSRQLVNADNPRLGIKKGETVSIRDESSTLDEGLKRIETEHGAADSSGAWDMDDKTYGGRESTFMNGETYIKAKSSNYWYKLSDLKKNQTTWDKITRKLRIYKGIKAYRFEGSRSSISVSLPNYSNVWNRRTYASGGMVDYTGPAWVDGTKSKPEAFLSAKDTEVIAGLRDVLRYTLTPAAYTSSSIQKNGDTYYEVHINVDELGDGYTVDDLVDEMEERILKATGKNGVVRIK